MYKYCNEILKHRLLASGLEPSINWYPARCSRPLSQPALMSKNEKSILIYYTESYHQSLLKLQSKTVIPTYKNFVHKRF